VTVPAVAAVILGGASLSGGTARPLGAAAGVLILCILRTGLTSLGVSAHVHEIVTGAILLAVAISDGPDLMRRIYELGLRGDRRQSEDVGQSATARGSSLSTAARDDT
jgi:hypothetical protein